MVQSGNDSEAPKVVVADLETNDKDVGKVDRIHCVGWSHLGSDKYNLSVGHNVYETLVELSELTWKGVYVGGHNWIRYDLEVIGKLYPDLKFNPEFSFCTLAWAKAVWADIELLDWKNYFGARIPPKYRGRYSLKSFGFRFGELKDDFGETTDWQEYSDEMGEYCKQDVKTNSVLVSKLSKRFPITHPMVKTEMFVTHILVRQQKRGFAFDEEAAHELYAQLVEEKAKCLQRLREIFPGRWKALEVFTPKRNNKTKGYVKGCPFTKIEWQEFNPGSDDQLIERLEELGWEPTSYTKNDKPKTSKEELELHAHYIEPIKDILEYKVIAKKISEVGGARGSWLKLVESDGRIRCTVHATGAVSGRMSHSKPNLAQVPRVGKPYGAECRNLFRAGTPGTVLVGIDASGIELRCLAHYLARWDGGEYAKKILEGDIHSENMRAAGLTDRDQAKTFIYALIYGAGNAKLGSIVSADARRGKALRSQFLSSIVGFPELLAGVEAKWKTSRRLKGLDGRDIWLRAKNGALNALLQSAAAVIMKRALEILDGHLLPLHGFVPGSDYEFVNNVHDEWQAEVAEYRAEDFGKLGVKAIEEAGKELNLRCPLTGEYKIGMTWKDTH